MEVWDSGCERIGRVMQTWIDDYMHLQPYSAEISNHRDGVSELEHVDTRRHKQVSSQWSVWRHHWRDGIHWFNRPVNGEEVAEIVRGGQGFQTRNKRSSGAAPTDSGAATPDRFGKLGGNPFNDILLVLDVAAESNDAISDFSRLYRALASSLFWAHAGCPPPADWWDILVVKLTAPRKNQDGERVAPLICSYSGNAGLSLYLSQIVANELARTPLSDLSVEQRLNHLTPEEQWNALGDVLSHDRLATVKSKIDSILTIDGKAARPAARVNQCYRILTPDEYEEWNQRRLDLCHSRRSELMPPDHSATVDLAADRDCLRMLKELLGEALCSKSPEHGLDVAERLVLWCLCVENALQTEIARRINRDPGQVTRTKDRTIRKVSGYIASRLQQQDSFATACRDCLETLRLKGLDGLLTETLQDAFILDESDDVIPRNREQGRGGQS